MSYTDIICIGILVLSTVVDVVGPDVASAPLPTHQAIASRDSRWRLNYDRRSQIAGAADVCNALFIEDTVCWRAQFPFGLRRVALSESGQLVGYYHPLGAADNNAILVHCDTGGTIRRLQNLERQAHPLLAAEAWRREFVFSLDRKGERVCVFQEKPQIMHESGRRWPRVWSRGVFTSINLCEHHANIEHELDPLWSLVSGGIAVNMIHSNGGNLACVAMIVPTRSERGRLVYDVYYAVLEIASGKCVVENIMWTSLDFELAIRRCLSLQGVTVAEEAIRLPLGQQMLHCEERLAEVQSDQIECWSVPMEKRLPQVYCEPTVSQFVYDGESHVRW